YEEARENADRMAMYRPTKSHRAAFERLCRGLYQPNDRKFYLLSGSYGTGKSHLTLMLANALSRSSGDPGMKGFFGNYEKLDPDTAKMLRNVRRDGQYLVAICDYDSGKRFEEVVLKAIFEACRSAGLDVALQSEFDEAGRLLDEWEKKGESGVRNFYEDFGKALSRIAPGASAEQLRSRLRDFDAEALSQFHAAFSEMMGGLAFQPRSGNLIPIVKNLIRDEQFKSRFKGLAVLYDEFGFTLEKAAYAKDVLQGFMETLCKNEPNVLFVGCIHKDFKAYADRYSKDDAAVMSARITPVDLLNEGIEEIIGAIVEVDKESAAWREEIQAKTSLFDQFLPACASLNLFPWLTDMGRIREKILEDIYGMHPMALACLLRLSSEIGSDARSTFTFFSGDVGGAEGSYADFIGKEEITAGGGKLSLYTADFLFVFFQRELSLKNTELRERQRQLVNGYYASLEVLRKSGEGDMFGELMEERLAILRAILVYELSQIPTTLENLQFGLYCLTGSEKRKVENHLKALVKTGAVFFRQQSKTYELAAGTGPDPYDLIDQFLADESLHTKDTLAALIEEAADPHEREFLKAGQYNLAFNEDKRFQRRFVLAKDLGKTLWNELYREWEQRFLKERDGGEGVVFYALCENETDIRVAREAVKENPYENMAVAVPHDPQPFADLLLRVKACRYFLPPNEAVKISAQTESRLRDIFENVDDGYLVRLKRIMQEIMDGEKACWHGKDGQVLVDCPRQSHQPADLLCERLYTQRCRINHPDLNLGHDDKWRTGRNNALKQAVKVLLESEKVMIDNGNPDNHGEKRYLEKVLLKGAGALRKTGEEGTVAFFECESDPDRISDNYPVLKALCRDLKSLPSGKTLSLGTFLHDTRNAPYGAGSTTQILALAHCVRAFGERLRVYADTTRTVEKNIDAYDDVMQIVADPGTKLVLEIIEISEAQRGLVEAVARAVRAPALKHGEIRSVEKTAADLKKWWQGLPVAARIADLYGKKEQPRLMKFRELLDSADRMERFDLILHRLPSLYSVEPVGNDLSEKDAKIIGEAFSADVKRLDSGLQRLRESVARAVCEVFGIEGDLVECENAIGQWYKGLSPNQRDPLKYDEGDACDLLTQYAKTDDIRGFLFKKLPEVFGFNPVENWTTVQTADYVAKIKLAKASIDEAKPEVPIPEIKVKTYEVEQGEDLILSVPKGAVEIIYTTTGEDPKKAEGALRFKEKMNLAILVKDRASVVVKMRALDEHGNASDMVAVEIVNKAKKYEINEKRDLFGNKEASFKVPDSLSGFITVLKSLLRQGVHQGLFSKEVATELEKTIRQHLTGKGDA
ncbi:MAG: hypothetical protein KJ663_03120, partial [Proteobacteria bacterium]|nr:hypothetical protein [Pseudomonadota bacterium]